MIVTVTTQIKHK